MSQLNMRRTPVDHQEYYVFTTESGEKIRTLKVDFDDIADIQEAWVDEHQPPEAPTRPFTTKDMGLKLVRQASKMAKAKNIPLHEAEQRIANDQPPIADPDDETFKRQMIVWEAEKFRVVEAELVQRGVLFDVDDLYLTLNDIVAHEDAIEMLRKHLESETYKTLYHVMSGQDRLRLYNHFVEISMLTWNIILKEAKKLGITRKGVPILETIPKGRGEAQSLYGVGVLSAREMNLSPTQFRLMSIKEQAEIVAAALCDQWREYYANVDARREAEINAARRG